MPSIIIPAHNEQTVIARCLDAILWGASPTDDLEVIVVCNGCTDATADAARQFGRNVRVLETPAASKVGALNMGDAAATKFPRFFVDADVVCPLSAVRTISRRLGEGVMAAAPRAKFDLAGCSWVVRAFYRISERLPSALEGIGGSGVYALNEQGHARIQRFPDVIADDGYVRLQFTPAERETVTDCYSTVFAPALMRELIRIKARSHMGTVELQRLLPRGWKTGASGNGRALIGLLADIRLWPSLMAYITVKTAARLLNWRNMRKGDRTWHCDQSSRARVRFERRSTVESISDPQKQQEESVRFSSTHPVSTKVS